VRIDDDGNKWDWCPECRRQRMVIDEYDDAALESGYMRRSTTEVGVWITVFECGHSKSELTGKDTTYRDPP